MEINCCAISDVRHFYRSIKIRFTQKKNVSVIWNRRLGRFIMALRLLSCSTTGSVGQVIYIFRTFIYTRRMFFLDWDHSARLTRIRYLGVRCARMPPFSSFGRIFSPTENSDQNIYQKSPLFLKILNEKIACIFFHTCFHFVTKTNQIHEWVTNYKSVRIKSFQL